MVITLIVLVAVFTLALFFNWTAYDKWFNIGLITLFGTSMISALLVMTVRGMTADEVPMEYPISSVGGQYTTNGTHGEYNEPTIVWYYKDKYGATLQTWQDAGSVGIRETSGEPRAFLTCPDDSTAHPWSLFPWEDPEPNCEYEFVTLYVPQGES